MPSVVSACAAPRTSHGRLSVALAVVDGVPELVEHRVHPPFAGLDVAQHAHVAGPVDVDAERVLALAVAGVEVAAVEDGAHVEAEAVVGAHGERLEVGVGEEVVDGDRALGGRGLEERVVVVPRPQLGRPRCRSGPRAGRRRRSSTPRTGPRWRGRRRRGWRRGGPRRARPWPARARSGRGRRAPGRPGCGAGRARGSARRPRGRSASTPPTRRGARRCRRWCAGSRRWRCRRRARRRSDRGSC